MTGVSDVFVCLFRHALIYFKFIFLDDFYTPIRRRTPECAIYFNFCTLSC